MTTTSPSAALVPVAPAFTSTERLALAGFLAGYSGLTRQAYELDLRQYLTWCQQHHVQLFAAHRADIECFARDLETRGRARATITRRLCTIAGFYRYAVEEDLLGHSPAAHVRRPRLDYESHAVGLDRNELGAILVAAGLGSPAEHALISLLALNGLRVSEATSVDIENLGTERGHRTLVISRKGGKIVTIPLAPRTARAIDLAIGDRCEGRFSWLPWAPAGPASSGADRAPGGPPRQDQPADRPAQHYDMPSSPRRWTRGFRRGMCRRPPRMLIRAPPCATTGREHPWTGTLPILSPPTSPEPRDNDRSLTRCPGYPLAARAAGPNRKNRRSARPAGGRELRCKEARCGCSVRGLVRAGGLTDGR